MPTHRRPSRPGGIFASRPRSPSSSLVLLLVWIASFFVPAGHVQDRRGGSPVPGTYHELPSCSAVAAGGAGALVVPSPGETGVAPADAQQAPGAR